MSQERSWTQVGAWILAGALVLLAGWKLLSPARGGGGAPVALSRPAPGAPAGRSGGGSGAYVHVAGAVRRPGLYRLAPGARIAVAIQRAGGARRGAELAAVNLAARVQDGQQVVVPRAGAGQAAAGGGGATGTKPSLATVTIEQLDKLDGIGPTLAKRIVEYRQAHGGFRSVDELKQVSGIGDRRFQSLRDALGP
jgi:competence protein ComEA